MRLSRVRLKLRWLMVIVALIALSFWAERMWRRRTFYLSQVAPHAKMETLYSGLAMDLAGVPRQPPSRTVSALTPDGKGLKFASHGPSPQVYYPLGSEDFADEATVKRLIAMCQQEAAKEGAIRRMFERLASYPWLPFDPEQLGR